MDQHQQDSDFQTTKPNKCVIQELVIPSSSPQEQSESSFSPHYVMQCEHDSCGNMKSQGSSFKKVSKSSCDLQNLENKYFHICAQYNFLGKCYNEQCKKRHITLTQQDGLEELILENIDLIDELTNSGKKLKIPFASFGTQLSKYRKCKSNNKEFCQKLEKKFNNDDFSHLGFCLALSSLQAFSQPDLNTTLIEKNPLIIKPKPLVDYKYVQEILENSEPTQRISCEIKKNLVTKLKHDIDRMQNKLKIISMLKRWIHDQQINMEEYNLLISSLSQIQQIHYSNFFKIADIHIIENKQQFQNIVEQFQQ